MTPDEKAELRNLLELVKSPAAHWIQREEWEDRLLAAIPKLLDELEALTAEREGLLRTIAGLCDTTEADSLAATVAVLRAGLQEVQREAKTPQPALAAVIRLLTDGLLDDTAGQVAAHQRQERLAGAQELWRRILLECEARALPGSYWLAAEALEAMEREQ